MVSTDYQWKMFFVEIIHYIKIKWTLQGDLSDSFTVEGQFKILLYMSKRIYAQNLS